MSVKPCEGDALIARYFELEVEIRSAQFPKLAVEEVTDGGETYMALRCPRCGSLATEDNLAAVDRALRWSYVHEPDDDSFDHQRLLFNGDGDGDYDATLYYLHNENHAVSLPEGWTEDWI